MTTTSLRFVIAVSNLDFQLLFMLYLLFTYTNNRNEQLIVSCYVNCFDSEYVHYFITIEIYCFHLLLNTFQTLHIERTTMHTASQLPGILRWFEVVETESITLNPIEAAIDTMDNKNKELRQLVAQYSTECAPNDLNPLTMRLNGNIDAAVGGGIAKYQEAFFSDDYIKQNPEYAPHIARLRALFLEQVNYEVISR